MKQVLLVVLVMPALFVAPACGSAELARRAETLRAELEAVRQEQVQVGSELDRVFFEATSSEREAGKSIAGAARCVVPKGNYRPAEPLSFGPARLRSQGQSWIFQEGAGFETSALQCVQATVSNP
ncbi:MAG: hypothetical protein QM765_27850 [Myxococcales bacterium]